MTILLATDFDDEEFDTWLQLLTQALPQERFVRPSDDFDSASVDIALVANPPRGALAGLAGLNFVQSLWAGVEKLLDDPSIPPNLPLARMVDPGMSHAMAETALWAALGLQRRFLDYAAQQHAGVWKVLRQRPAAEVKVAVLGLGEMGRAAARRLVAQGFRVHGWTRQEAIVEGVVVHSGAKGLPAALADAEIVINLLPLTDETRGLFNRSLFDAWPHGASLVNLGRGAHVIDADLLDALECGRVQRAVLDVFTQEPLPSNHPFWHHPKVTILPHVAAPTNPLTAVPHVAHNVRCWRVGEPLIGLVDRRRGY
jgi:glyoxylate/hydroxypyruvate reductase A